MLQDIEPNKIDINYKNREIQMVDNVIIIDRGDILLNKDVDENSRALYPRYGSLKSNFDISTNDCNYLFSIDEEHYYLYKGKLTDEMDSTYKRIERRELYSNFENLEGYVAYTACHIHDWLNDYKYCGRCGTLMKHKIDERVLECPSCELTKYPQINPVVIVCIHNGDKILLTKYANASYDRYALVAGFVEIGESFEAAVHREVMEEVGVKVKNIEYYASQPWGISGGLMAGYFAELDGDPTITLDTKELKEGTWLTKEEMPKVHIKEKSLTRTLMYEWYQKQ